MNETPDKTSQTANNNLHKSLNLNVRGLKTSATLAINEQSKLLQQQGQEVFRLGLGQSPFPVPDTVVEALRRHAHQKDYLPVKGLMALREAVAGFNVRTQHISSHPENILIGPGSKELIFLLQLVYYGDLVIPTPSWVSYSPQAQILGRNVQWAPTREENFWRLSYEDLDRLCQADPSRPRIFIINYPSNPTGYTYPIERLQLLAEMARKYNVILVSDEIYGLTHFRGQHVSVARYYPEGTIISSGLSKWCGAGGWRLGTFSFPPQLRWLMDAMAVVASETFTSTSAPIQHAAVTAFLGNEEIDDYLLHSRRVLRNIARTLTDMLHTMGINTPMPHGAFYLFPNFEPYREALHKKQIFTSADLCTALLKDTGIAILPGSDFGRPAEELTARIAYVDFHGAKALESSKKYTENGLPAGFFKETSPALFTAFERLGNWLGSLV